MFAYTVKFLYIDVGTISGIIDHLYHYISTEMDADLIVQHMLIQQLLNEEEFQNLMNAASSYQKNCLLLEKVRRVGIRTMESFCKLLRSFDSQKHIADVLVNGT